MSDRSRITRRRVLGWMGLGTAGLSCGPAPGAQGETRVRACSAPSCDPIETEVLVCGGGPSGTAAAVNAARAGAKVLLVERYGRLGGMAVQAMVAPLMGSARSPYVDEVTRRLGGNQVDYEQIDLRYAELIESAGADLLLHAWVAETLMIGNRVCGVTLMTKQGRIPVRAKVTVDATGDGDVAWMAGAEFEQGRPSDGLVQPMSIMFRVSGVEGEFLCGSEQAALKARVGDRTWHEIALAANAKGELPKAVGIVRIYSSVLPGDRVINATQVNRLDGTNARDLTSAELDARRQAIKILEFLKRHGPGFEKSYVSGMPAVIGVRETRRFLGKAYLEREDLLRGERRADAVVREANFPIDIHNPDGVGQAEGLAQNVRPYDIPYGCLVPRDRDGLLLAGRCISGSHAAFASYRVQRIAAAIGAAAGAAAALSVKGGSSPAEVDPAEIRAALGLA